MSRNSRKTHRNSRNNHNTNSGADTTKPSRVNKGRREVVEAEDEFDFEATPIKCKPLTGKTPNQRSLMNAIENNDLIFAWGPAGTGKTYIPIAMAADMLKVGEIERIIITRPVVDAGEKLGYLPGDLNEKFSVYIDPHLEIFYERLGKSFTQYLIKRGKIVGKPLAYMRGSTFNDAFVVFDEVQNASPLQVELLLTRIGMGTKTVVCGDLRQKDISGASGLADALAKLQDVPGTSFVEFTMDDCVRSSLVRHIIKAYNQG